MVPRAHKAVQNTGVQVENLVCCYGTGPARPRVLLDRCKLEATFPLQVEGHDIPCTPRKIDGI